MARLGHLPGPARLAVACFVLTLAGAILLGQATLWVRDGGGRLPHADQVLWKYHGRPHATRLDQVLDLDRPADDPRAMWPYLHPDGVAAMATIRERRTRILAWVDAGAPESGWSGVADLFTGYETCGACHVPGGRKQDLPFETWEQVRRVTEPDRGMRAADLLVSAHNHAFAFAVAALLLSLGVAFTGLPRGLKVLLVVGAFGGAVVDVGSWLLTKAYGAPWHLAVMAGGAVFGIAVGVMSLAVLMEVARGRPRGPGPG